MKTGVCAQTQGRDRKCYFYASDKQILRFKRIFYGNSKPKTDKKEAGTGTFQKEVVSTQ